MDAITARPFDVVVVGRGPVGATAALSAAAAGWRTAWLGRAAPRVAGDGWDPRVYALSPTSRRLLEQVRAWPAMDADRIAPVQRMRVRTESGDRAPVLNFDAWESGLESLAWIVEHRNLADALDRAVGFAPVETVDGAVGALTLPGEHAADLARLTLDDGRVLQARLVVAADGAGSPLRALAGIDAPVREYPQHAVVANFETTHPHRGCAAQWFGAHGILALLPLPGERVAMVWSAAPELAAALQALDADGLAARVSALTDGTLGALRTITAPQAFPLRLIRPERVVAPRFVLAGDAAHVVHPLAGQGMNLGFGDVLSLARRWVEARTTPQRDPGAWSLLRAHARARAEPVAAMRWATDGLQRLFDAPPAGWAAPPVAALRNLGWRLVENAPWLKRRLIAGAARG